VDTDKIVIEPIEGWRMIDFSELAHYRDLFYFLVWRDIKVLYAQTVLGFAWAILNPTIQIVIFTLIFGRVAQISTDGIPYLLFSTVAIVPWTYMSNAMNSASQSLVGGQAILGKIYFPRVIFPLTPVLAKLVDFGISLVLILAAMVYFKVSLTWNILLLPVFLVFMILIPIGVGLWLSALAIRFRDVKFAMAFVVRMLMYSAPIVYTASAIPDNIRFYYSLNPIVAVIEGLRASILGTPLEWQFVIPGMITTILLVATGLVYFRRLEKVFVDVI
jgi:lipopolysaccharide transport system permease protein